ncbi:MAG: periplasmic sensor signal transduction histidine kinase [Frankiales bacterium]|nr:periplasmic sensor signal transduction histidine kinase [Frankiales bacterium]
MEVARGPSAAGDAAVGALPAVIARRTAARGPAWQVARDRWRRSLQTRVVVTTLVVSGVVVLLLATLVLDQVGRGLVEAKSRSALAEAQLGVAQVQTQLATTSCGDPDCVQSQLQTLTQQLSDRGATGDLYSVFVQGSDQTKGFASPGLRADVVPPGLTARLMAGQPSAYAYSHPPGRPPLLVVGSVVSAPRLGQYRVYHVFPLTAEERTLALVRRTAAVAGLLLVALLALIALLVTRQVVSPVRMAARTAERLASGRLEERMEVRGEDEIARLASTFNSMAEALQRQIRQLEDLSRVQRRFVSDVSHELRTPLTTVRMAADVLHEGRADFPPAAARSAELLQAELDRFEELLVDLLEISRYDAGAATIEPDPVDLVPLVRRVVERTSALAERKGSLLDLAGLPAEPVVAELDHVRIERVLRNLLVNAVEHGEGRPVEISVAGDDDTVAVLVRDHGIGLRPGEAGLVFTRFWRGDPSRARTTGGTGLGLAIALEDVRLHGGWLQAWGEPGVGAAFRMTLPRRAGAIVDASPLPLRPDGGG